MEKFKIKLTQEQAEALDTYKRNGRDLQIFVEFSKDFKEEYKSLKKFSVDKMARLLYEPNSYEVEEVFKVGDWAAFSSSSKGLIVCKVENVSEKSVDTDYVASNGYKQNFIKANIRHATSEEIKAEKERRNWASIGRKVGEFRDGDRGIHASNTSITNKNYMKECYKAGNLLGIYPAEAFVSFVDGDDE